MIWYKRQDPILHKLVLEHRKNNTLLYKILDIDISTYLTYADRAACIDRHIPGLMARLPALFCEHYRKHNVIFWRLFLWKWLPICTNITILYTSRELMPELYTGVKTYQHQEPYICSVMMYVKKRDHVYGRVLCSNCFVGSKMIQYMKDTYRDSPYKYISLHSDHDVVSLYKKHGWSLTDMGYVDVFGVKHPFMYMSMSDSFSPEPGDIQEDDFLCETIQPFDTWFFLCMVAVIVKLLWSICIRC